jgi:hypothetical protein
MAAGRRPRMTSTRTRIYEIYEGPSGLSTQTVDYRGEFYIVAAVSIRQAYWLIGNRQWAASSDRFIGIIEHYTRNGPPEGWHRLWDGCRIHHGLGIRHGAAKTSLLKAMRAHEATHV